MNGASNHVNGQIQRDSNTNYSTNGVSNDFSTGTDTFRNRSSDFENKVAFITGSTSGIGLCIARNFAARGCNVILSGLGDKELIEKIKDEFTTQYQVDSHYVHADLCSVHEIEQMCNEINKLYPEGIDILVNNAGFQHVSPVENFPEEKWESMISVMLSAPFYLTKYLCDGMRQKGWGRILNMSSAHGHVASPNKAAYVAAKHGLIGLTKVTALEMAMEGVTCNAICPGFVDTPILKKQVQTLQNKLDTTYEEAQHKFLEKFHATKQCVGAQQIAETACFLCSDAASQMTGSSMIMDGGWTAK